MKAIITEKEEEKKFKPFDLTLTVETEQEARLLFHVFNRSNLRSAIFTGTYDYKYNKDIKAFFNQNEYELISKELNGLTSILEHV